MKYKNPVISGFHPDPSVCRVGDDYYLVNSSFEYFPGIPVFHSKDLIHWEQIGHCITRNEQITYRKGAPNCSGMFAPTIRYSNGIFYVICTNVTFGQKHDGNFIVWTDDPAGEWSDPVWLKTPGIDPSLFWDDDGKVYYTGTYQKIFVCEINPKTGEVIGERKKVWGGTGGNDPEGPHIYKRNGWYYLLISEGGTEYGHMVTVARSKDIFGPYESCPRNPVLTNRSTSLPIKAVGHADLIEDTKGNWWAICHGIRTISYPFKHNLGRETLLVPVTWDEEGWPVFGNAGMVKDEIEVEDMIEVQGSVDVQEGAKKSSKKGKVILDNFSGTKLKPEWNFIYNPCEELWQLHQNKLTLYGSETALSDAESLAWVGRRQEHLECIASTQLRFIRMQDNEEAGISIYLNNKHHYEAALTRIHDKGYIILRRQIGSLWKIENQIPYNSNTVVLELHCSKDTYSFWYGDTKDEVKFLGKGETEYLTTEVGGKFTGNYIALYATGNGVKCREGADFEWFEYKAGRE